MPKIRIVDDVTGEVKDIDCIGYNLQYATADGEGYIQKIRKLNNGKWDWKHWIKNEYYRPLAEKIKEKYKEDIPEFNSINLDKILWLEDIEYVGDEIKRDDEVMWIKRLSKQAIELTGYRFIIYSREFWMSRISNEQILWHIYSTLRCIDDGDKLKGPDLVGWKEVIGTLGYGWETTLSPVQDIMRGFEKSDFLMLRKADKQISIFDLEDEAI